MLDVNTPKGRQTLQEESNAVSLFTERYPQVSYVHTPKTGPATVDALLMRDTELIGVVETKCRQMTNSQLAAYGNEWLVTWDKIDGARRVAAALGVPLYGFLYLVTDETLLIVPVADSTGNLTRSIRVEATKTQATVNGGTAVRNNAYISTNGSTKIHRRTNASEAE